MRVYGFKRNNFVNKEGENVTGYDFYLGYPLSGEDADGCAVQKHYLSDNRLAACGYTPAVGDEVEPSYNRYRKIIALYPTSKKA